MAKATGLIIFRCSVEAGAFWHAAVYAMHSSWTYQCPPLPYMLADSQKCQFGGSM